MKNSIIAVLAVITAFSASSCASKGMSKEFQAKMTAFETDWKNTGDEMKSMSKSMDTRFEEMKKMHADAMGSMEMGDMKHDDMKMDAKKDDKMEGMEHMDMSQCTNIDQRIADMKAKCDAAMASWEADEKSYGEWKEKVKKGEVDEATAETGLKGWEDKLAAYKASGMQMAKDMDALYTDVKAHAEMDMSMHKM